MPDEGMAFDRDPVVAAPLGLTAEMLLEGATGLGLVGGPVEAEGGVVEEVGELTLVAGLHGSVIGAEHGEGVAAEKEGVTRLLDAQAGVGHRLPLGVDHAQGGIALPVLLDASTGRGEDSLFAHSAPFVAAAGSARGEGCEQEGREQRSRRAQTPEHSGCAPFTMVAVGDEHGFRFRWRNVLPAGEGGVRPAAQPLPRPGRGRGGGGETGHKRRNVRVRPACRRSRERRWSIRRGSR